MMKLWNFFRTLAAVEYSVKHARLLTGMWGGLTLMALLILCLYIFLIPGEQWGYVTYLVVNMTISAMFFRASIGKLSRANARAERVKWEESMLAQW